MKAAAHAAARVDSVLMAKGKLRGSDTNNKARNFAANGGFKGQEMYTTEFEINEAPPSARTLLTKGYVQEEINSYSGAIVSTRGRFMTEQEKARCSNERSLYLYIQGHNKHNIDLAIQKIGEIIKTEHQSSLNRPSRFTNAPPPLMSLHSATPTVEKICVGIENAPQGFDLRGRIIGAGGSNLLYIRGETGATVTLRGRGSQFVDPVLGVESPEPLHLYIEHIKAEVLQNAKQLAINLIQTMQSELQSYIQQQPPPIQPQVIEQPHIQQIQQAQFQTMNIGALGQPNVVTIQHQDLIQHPQSSVMTLPATILTATVAGGPGGGVSVPPPGVHIPSHSGPCVSSGQPQEMQTFMSPPPVGQVQLIGPPPTVSQVQYQIHPAQSLQIQGIQVPPPGSQNSPQSVTQMYVMSQPPPPSPAQQNYIASSSVPVSSAVSYVYTQPNIQRPSTPSQSLIETVNVNLQQPPPSAPINITQQPPPPLLHLHFPPPNFPHNQPPPPIPQTYQIQYQQVQAPGNQSQTQFVLQPGEHIVPQMQQTHEPPPSQHTMPPQFEGQHPPQFHLQVPPPSTQTFLVPNAQSAQHQQPPPQLEEIPHHQQDVNLEQGPPQPVPPPQMVPPPSANQGQNSMNIITSVPPPTQVPPPQSAPWLYQPQPHQMQQSQAQIQLPSASLPMHSVPPPQIQAQIQYHTQQIQYQNGQMQAQVHYTIQPPPMQQPLDQKPGSPEQKHHGVKRRFSDADGSQESLFQCGPPPIERHGTGENDRHQQISNGPPPGGIGAANGSRNKMLIPSPHPGEKRNGDKNVTGHVLGNEQTNSCESSGVVPAGPPPQAPWQACHIRTPWGRPPPPPRDGEHHVLYPAPPPINMPPPQIRPHRNQIEGSRSPPSHQNVLTDHLSSPEYHQIPHYTTKPPPYNSVPLMQAICNPPPPPPLHHQRHQHLQQTQPYQVPISQSYQPPASCPPWMN
ncbi:altered inheritance of mitochondria protein 3-like isoform X2 [Athalia rosae]|uniref:altered inheritance of mitochondria protein 3-like isoform X2 n=1 Tax=Athalia rosae TaxID=37344 RepID=UPI002033D419|nr:altered inheritance of mitochondria protein 3-like isoform X2 [Athalia rosae]